MTEEPYRWLEAIANRREYVLNQIKDGSPVLAISLDAGILVVGVGTGQGKVFEVFDRQAVAGLGHPADLERLRQALIDAAHLEAFTRAAEDVTLRRLVAFNLGPQLKTAFEQIFAPPFLVRLLLAELGREPAGDTLMKLSFDGSFAAVPGRCAVVAGQAEMEAGAEEDLARAIAPNAAIDEAGARLLSAWRTLTGRTAIDGGQVVEAALLRRTSPRAARFERVAATGWSTP